jgi:hypothetical protein
MSRRRRRFVLPAALIALGLWLQSGCVFIPTFNRTIKGSNVAQKVGAEGSGKPLRLREATREDVIRVLGRPAHASSDGRILAYRWEVQNGVLVLPLCFKGFSVSGERMLVLRFQEDATLARFEVLAANGSGGIFGGSRGRVRLPEDLMEDSRAEARARAAAPALPRPIPAPASSTTPPTGSNERGTPLPPDAVPYPTPGE